MIAMEKVAQIKADMECQGRGEEHIWTRVVSVCLTTVTSEQQL